MEQWTAEMKGSGDIMEQWVTLDGDVIMLQLDKVHGHMTAI